MGGGDWNDGMNRVGSEGRGESVWLAWFLCSIVTAWLPLARSRGDTRARAALDSALAGWRLALNTTAWDGAWFKRAFFDDGSPLGSATMPEARIDLIAQAWSVLSDQTSPERQRLAMDAVEAQLVDEEHGLIRLLDPPLQHANPSAGYIQAYPPGVRENGGQYAHAGVWALMAAARLALREPGHTHARNTPYRYFTYLSPAHRAAHAQWARPTGWSRMRWRPMCTASRPTRAAAAGAGTPGRRAGCTARPLESILGLQSGCRRTVVHTLPAGALAERRHHAAAPGPVHAFPAAARRAPGGAERRCPTPGAVAPGGRAPALDRSAPAHQLRGTAPARGMSANSRPSTITSRPRQCRSQCITGPERGGHPRAPPGRLCRTASAAPWGGDAKRRGGDAFTQPGEPMCTRAGLWPPVRSTRSQKPLVTPKQQGCRRWWCRAWAYLRRCCHQGPASSDAGMVGEGVGQVARSAHPA
jgi:hypothetical protein